MPTKPHARAVLIVVLAALAGSAGAAGAGDALPASAAKSRLEMVRRAVAGLGDLDAIIERYRVALPQITDPSVSAQAEADLAMWEDRKSQQMTKVGDQWVTPEQLATLRQGAGPKLERAADLAQKEQLKAARQILDEILLLDPKHPGALYLKGVVAYRARQITLSRTCFEQAVTAMPDYGPALNNLAVVQFEQRPVPRILTLLTRALQAAPDDEVIHNNAGEILHLLSGKELQSRQAQELLQVYASREAEMVKQKQQAGYHRWGSRWVSDSEFATLEQERQRNQKQLDELNAQLAEAQRQFDKVAAEIAQNLQDMKVVEKRNEDTAKRSGIKDVKGNPFPPPLPDGYYSLQARNYKLEGDKLQIEVKLNGLEEEVARLQGVLPRPTYTGTLELIGEEGTPGLRAPAAPPAASNP